jgi:micrococcal nuclease
MTRRLLTFRLTSLVLLLLCVAVSGVAQAQQPLLGYVTRVVDGDTIYVAIGNQIESVRYIGINAPELHHPTRGEEPGGAAAREVNRALVEGRWITLVLDVAPRDRYGRVLAYVWVDGRFVNGELVWRGYAQAATYPPNARYADYFRALEGQARTASRGLWATVGIAPQGQAQAALPGAKTADSTAGAPTVHSSPLPADAPIAKSSSDRTQSVHPYTRSDGTAVGGYSRAPARR